MRICCFGFQQLYYHVTFVFRVPENLFSCNLFAVVFAVVFAVILAICFGDLFLRFAFAIIHL